jgi:hypothetical protein
MSATTSISPIKGVLGGESLLVSSTFVRRSAAPDGQKKNIPQSDFEQHKLQCTFQSNSKRCSRCWRRGFDRTSDHFKTCPFRTCGTCCKSIPPGTTHNCSRKHCFNCNKRNIPEHEFERHKLQCNFKFCINFLGRFPIDVAHDCSKKKCISCLRHYPRQEFAQHYSQCYALFRDRKLALKASGHCIRLRYLRQVACLNPREKDALYCKEHFDEKLAGILYDRKQNTAAEQQFFRKKLLRKTGHSPLWRNPSISAVAQIWHNSPQNVALCDIETSYICNATSHTDIYEVAIMDARGE